MLFLMQFSHWLFALLSRRNLFNLIQRLERMFVKHYARVSVATNDARHQVSATE